MVAPILLGVLLLVVGPSALLMAQPSPSNPNVQEIAVALDANANNVLDKAEPGFEDGVHVQFQFVDVPTDRGGQPPTADFVASPNDPLPGDEVTFDASQSFDPDGNIVDYIWDFGDGASGRGLSTTHVFEREGAFTVALTVVDNDGLSDGVRISLNVHNKVLPSPPVITGIESPSTVAGNSQPVPLSVAFSDLNGDLAQIRFRTVQGPNASNPPQTSDLGSFQGQTSGTINLSIFCQNVGDTPRPFPVTDEIVLVDALGLESAPVTYSYTCLPA